MCRQVGSADTRERGEGGTQVQEVFVSGIMVSRINKPQKASDCQVQ